MQKPQADINKCCKVGTEELLFRFRPSPNFKKMKKFLQLKLQIDFTDNSNHSPPHGDEQLEPVTSLEEQRALLEKAKPVQPPLPLEPPPASPINYNLPQKQEIDDHDYHQNSPGSPTLNQQESLPANYIVPQSEKPDKRKKEICRDFIRGDCIRAGLCRYAHERDLSQLVGVYTFCKNYQNSVCTYPLCKYVHATIFEEQRFYRTGILPPHALAHKKPNLLPPPPPPPEEPPVEVSMFTRPPPALVPCVDKPVITCVPTANLETRPIDDFIINPAPRDLDNKAKKCKTCDTMEFRLQFNKDKTENMQQSALELKNKVALLSKKTHTLYSVLFKLMKPQASKRPEGHNGLSMSSLFNNMGEAETNLLSNLLLKDTLDQNFVTGTRDS